MTETIKIINLKVTKVQETETETDSGTTNKWTYTLQDDDKDNTVTLKTSSEKSIELGDTLDVRIGNDQTTLEIHSGDGQLDLEQENEAGQKKQKRLPDSIENNPGAKEAIEEAEELIEKMDEEIQRKKNAPKKDEYCKFYYRGGLCANSQMDKPFCVGVDECPEWNTELGMEKQQGLPMPKEWTCNNCGETGIQEGTEHTCKPKKKKGSPETPSKEKEPYQIIIDEVIEHGNQYDHMFEGTTYLYPTKSKGEDITRIIGILNLTEDKYSTGWVSDTGGFHKIKSKALPLRNDSAIAQVDLEIWAKKKKLEIFRGITEETPEPKGIKADMTEEEKAGQDEKDAWVPPIPVGNLLLKKEDFPKDLCGGLMEDVKVQKTENGDRFLYAHAKVKTTPTEGDAKNVNALLESLTEYNWTYTHGLIFNCDKNQLNKIKEA